MAVTFQIPSSLKDTTGNKTSIEVTGQTVGEALQGVAKIYPAFGEKCCDEKGHPRRFLTLVLNGKVLQGTQELNTPVGDGHELTIIPAMAGGQ